MSSTGSDAAVSRAATRDEIAGAFSGAAERGARQAEVENRWAAFARERYAGARAKAEEARALLR